MKNILNKVQNAICSCVLQNCNACKSYLLGVMLLMFTFTGCKKFVEIDDPDTRILTPMVFSSLENATGAMNNIYYEMVNQRLYNITSAGMTVYLGMAADELKIIETVMYDDEKEFYTNSLQQENSNVELLWSSAYQYIYNSNAIIEGLEQATGITDSAITQIRAQAIFVRAFMHFNLVNLFGPIPYITTTNWRKTNQLTRTSEAVVYSNIIDDLLVAQRDLLASYAASKGRRIIPNKSAATALLARVYLYQKNWVMAEKMATDVINTAGISLEPTLDGIFKSVSKETIWQLQMDSVNGYYNVTPDALSFIPLTYDDLKSSYTPELLNAFEPDDLRKTSWVTEYWYAWDEETYKVPYKYKVSGDDGTLNGPLKEMYVVFRLAEQYLIRAEARAEQETNLSGAADDLFEVRRRANLPRVDAATKEGMLALVAQERRIELLAEWGHRWLDLKRTGKSTEVLLPLKPQWKGTATLLPIPVSELQTNPNLDQNDGYKK